MIKRSTDLRHGIAAGIPIFLGYLSVSFGFGIFAVKSGLSTFQSTLISLTCLTSAGQAAGVGIITAGGSIIEMILVQITINIRYSLMALSLSQNLDKSFTRPQRFIASYGITDEIFGLCAAQKEPLRPFYMYGMILISTFGWVMGTLLGAAAGNILPTRVSEALGIILYGMFIAIIIPPAKKERSIFLVIIISAALSIGIRYLLPMISGGFSVIICAVAASAFGAALFPQKKEDGE